MGIRTQCKIGEIGQKMQASFDILVKDLELGQLTQPDFVVAIYNRFDLVSRDVDYVSGFMYSVKPNLAPNLNYKIGSALGHKAIKVVHTGSYKHLGNAWSTAMGARMSLNKRINKQVPMYEIYDNDPHETEEEDLITSIYVPVR